jgi:hypothetical protein
MPPVASVCGADLHSQFSRAADRPIWPGQPVRTPVSGAEVARRVFSGSYPEVLGRSTRAARYPTPRITLFVSQKSVSTWAITWSTRAV